MYLAIGKNVYFLYMISIFVSTGSALGCIVLEMKTYYSNL